MFGRRAFSVAGPAAWNSLPGFLRDPSRSFDSFRTRGFAVMRYINLLLTLTLTLLGSRGIGNEIVGGNGMRMGMDVVGMGLAFSQ